MSRLRKDLWNMKFETRLQRTQNMFFLFFFVCVYFLWRLYTEETRLRKNIHCIVWWYSLECLAHSPECLATTCWTAFPGLSGHNPWNVSRHYLECNIPLIHHVPRIPFSDPVLSVLCRCQLNKKLMDNVCIVVLILKLLNMLVYWKQQVCFSNECGNSLLKNIVAQETEFSADEWTSEPFQ